MAVKIDASGRVRRAPDELVEFTCEMLTSRDERRKLPRRPGDPYWSKIGEIDGGTTVLLGYHARRSGESEWTARWVDRHGCANHTILGICDDRKETKGVLTHGQARAKAEEWARAQMAKRR